VIEIKVREKYAGLSYQELIDKAYQLGFNYEKYSRSCSQSTVVAIHELLEIDSNVVRVATSSCAGQVDQVVGTCGGLIGGTMVLDYFFGRPAENMSYQECVEDNLSLALRSVEIAKQLYNKYVQQYGTILCPHIQVQLFGRHYCLQDEDDSAKFNQDGAHSDPDKCCHIVGNAAKWTMELLQSGLLS